MAGINKNFVVKNGLEVKSNLLLADTNKNSVGIGTSNINYKLHVLGGIGATSLNVVGFGTINSLHSPAADLVNLTVGVSTIGQLNASSGIVTHLTGTAVTFSVGRINEFNTTTLYASSGIVTNLSGTGVTYTSATLDSAFITSGIVTTLSGTNISYSGIGTINTLNGTNISYSGIGTINTLNGTNISYSGIGTIDTIRSNVGFVTTLSGTNISYSGISTFGTVQIASGIITATSGIVTYYGDGSKLVGTISGIGINTLGGNVGYGATILDFRGVGISTVLVASGIATINVVGQLPFGANGYVQYYSNGGFGGSVNVTTNGTDLNVAGVVTATDFNSTSDASLKENVYTIENALDVVSQLRGVTFDWKSSHTPSIGVIAQELEEVLPQLVTDTDPKTVNYNGIIGVLIEAIKELKAEVEELKSYK